MNTHGFEGRTVLTERKRNGQVKEGGEPLQGRIGCKLWGWRLTNGFVHHRVDRQCSVIVEKCANRTVHGIGAGGGCLLVAGEPTENNIISSFLMTVTGEELHGAVLVHESSNPHSLFALTVGPSGVEVPFDSSRGWTTG